MYNPYGLHSWSKQRREEALREAQMRRLAKRRRKKTTRDRASGWVMSASP